jgi:DNA repair protein RadC
LGDEDAKKAAGRIQNLDQAISHFAHRFLYPDTEFLCVLFLTENGDILDTLMQEGFEDGVDVNLRSIMWRALENDAANLMLAHNHPSGIAQPSQADHSATHRLAVTAKGLGIGIVDHLIHGAGNWFSFRRAGLL